MKKILTIIGARPQFIKAAALSHELKNSSNFQEILVHTGQHFDQNMSEIFFQEMGIPQPKYNLNINSQSHASMTGNMLMAIEKVIVDEKPHLVVVYGDTNSTLAGALAASKLQIPVAHVEAGLRSRNIRMPEEVNRIITDKLSDFLFCPSAESVANLISEGVSQNKVFEVGDIMLDSLNLHRQKASSEKTLLDLGIKKPYVLATIHRQENLNDPKRLQDIFYALAEINEELKVVLPVHPALRKTLPHTAHEFKLIEPQSYLSLLGLLEGANLIFTDSGGLQKEAYYMQKFCITLRDETEWTELIRAGVNKLAGADQAKIKDHFQALNGKPFIAQKSIYGYGNSAQQIAEVLKAQLA